MSVVVSPTLRSMARIYGLPAAGGDGSERFRAYVEACRAGALLHGFNPMTSKPVAALIDTMLGFEAEQVLHDAGVDTAQRLGADDDVLLFLSVAAPGLWTDREASAIDHVLAPRHVGEVQLWLDEEVTPQHVRSAGIEQTVRALWRTRRPERRPTLATVARREGLASALAGRTGSVSDAAAEVLDVLADDTSYGTAVAFLFGDDAASRLGYSALGLHSDEGLRHAIACLGPVDGCAREIDFGQALPAVAEQHVSRTPLES